MPEVPEGSARKAALVAGAGGRRRAVHRAGVRHGRRRGVHPNPQPGHPGGGRWPRSASCSTWRTPSATRKAARCYGGSALVAMLHDVLIVLGPVFHPRAACSTLQIDALFITGAADRHRLLASTTPSSSSTASGRTCAAPGRLVRGDGQLQRQPDPRPLHQHLAVHHLHPPRAAPPRRRHDPQLRPGAADRHHQRHVLVHLQRHLPPGGVGERGAGGAVAPPHGAGAIRPRPAA